MTTRSTARELKALGEECAAITATLDEVPPGAWRESALGLGAPMPAEFDQSEFIRAATGRIPSNDARLPDLE